MTKKTALYSRSHKPRADAGGIAAAPSTPAAGSSGSGGPATADSSSTPPPSTRPSAGADWSARGVRARSGRRTPPATAAATPPAGAADPPGGPGRLRRFLRRHERSLLLAGGAAFALLLVAVNAAFQPLPKTLSTKEVEDTVIKTLETAQLPSMASKAYEIIRPSVVRVRRLGRDKHEGADGDTGVGSGVVIVDKGVILTNLHVVAGAGKIGVVFFDGMESEAVVISTMPENDLAVLQAKTIPDDLQPATLRSTADLAPGDDVVAVGFPFGIGPSATAGVISGLRREYRSPEGKRQLTNLIQFDAAANPGSSGGPLVTADGEVVGIVTGILNPTEQRVFIGIGFAVPIENAASAVGISPF